MTDTTAASPDTFAAIAKAMADASNFLVEYDGELVPVTSPSIPERFRIKYLKRILRGLSA